MADDSKNMAEDTPQERFRQENEMARGPVSRGASNQEAPMYQGQKGETAHSQHTSEPYEKLLKQRPEGSVEGTGMSTDRTLGSIGGGTLPDGPGEARGGIATSDSTVSGGGSSAGSVIGEGFTRDRGRMPDQEMDVSTDTTQEQENQEQGRVPTRLANQDTPGS